MSSYDRLIQLRLSSRHSIAYLEDMDATQKDPGLAFTRLRELGNWLYPANSNIAC